MQTQRFTAEHYTSKGSAEGHPQDGGSQVQLSAMAHNPSAMNTYGANNTPDHALVLLQQGSGSNAKPIASFTPDQARKLADALHAAADANLVY